MKKTNIAQMSKDESRNFILGNGYIVDVYAIDDDTFGVEISVKKSLRKSRVLTDCVYMGIEDLYFKATQVEYLLEHLDKAQDDFEVGLAFAYASVHKPKTTTKKSSSAKSKPRAPKGKGKTALQKDLDKLAGTGDNSKAHKVMCKHGLKNAHSDEYKAIWQGYWWTIR